MVKYLVQGPRLGIHMESWLKPTQDIARANAPACMCAYVCPIMVEYIQKEHKLQEAVCLVRERKIKWKKILSGPPGRDFHKGGQWTLLQLNASRLTFFNPIIFDDRLDGEIQLESNDNIKKFISLWELKR